MRNVSKGNEAQVSFEALKRFSNYYYNHAHLERSLLGSDDNKADASRDP
jgi:hypothetical protein